MSDDTNDTDPDFAMLTPPTRPGPCKAATTPEVDPVEARLERERQAAPHITAATCLEYKVGNIEHNRRVFAARMAGRGLSAELANMMADCAEVRHGSGKVKV